MKSYLLLFLFAAPLFIKAQSNNPLEKKITITFNNTPVSIALKQIGAQANCSFVYANQLLNTNRNVSRSYKAEILSNLLLNLFDGQVQLRADGNQVYIKALPSGIQTLSGQIFFEGRGIPGASIRIDANHHAVSDQNGKYLIKGLAAANYSVEVSSIGFKTLRKTIQLTAGTNKLLDFSLDADAQQLQQVQVTGKNDSQKKKESGFNVNVLDVNQFNNSNRDLNQLLNATAGVRIREQGGLGSNFNFSINGLSGKAVRFFIDGIPMENYGVGMTLNNIPVNLAERIEVFKGVVPVELGADAMGGAVNVITNKGTRNYMDASLSYGSFNTQRASLNSQYVNVATGLVFKLTGFYNYSDNNYLMRSNPKYDAPIRIPDGTGQFKEVNLKRFHDDYRSGMIQGEVGIVNKKWADVFMVSMLYNKHYKEFQTGATQNTVYGKIDRRGDLLMPSVRYKKDDLFVKGLTATAFLSYGREKYAVADTSLYGFWWDGSHTNPDPSPYGEFGGGISRSLFHYQNEFLLGRINLDYRLNDQHSITFNYNYNRVKRESYDELSTRQENPAAVSREVLGLAWKNQFLEGRMKNTVFGKAFRFKTNVDQIILPGNVNATQPDNSARYNNYGGGLASRYALNSHIGLRLSYEHTYRLPEQVELLGDGLNVVANPDIKPESSHNINVGGDYSVKIENHQYAFDVSGFIRDASNFIYSTPWGNNQSKYLNERKIIIKGVEAEAQYKYADLFNITLNATYQRTKQNQRYVIGTQNANVTFGNAVPNQPYLFGNAFIAVGKNNLTGKGQRLQFDWSSQYIHWFFLNWEGYGSSQSQNKIPTQFVHNAGITYSVKEGKYNIGLESRNVFNQLAYDNFRLQKPGRSFNIKLRYFIQ
ncbi:TonB-dependent receptor plug domain-containing protein [Pedobacter sp. MC2016-14]|uniref:TonB-dependent receptor n=1 Tax=Pedobacter sp. MC2016-14 TaxID=2897327 RepID=UPI001E5AC855|nr:TonB-dependent receptor [Pedobacter sp. MC2016-14]MCD0489158.1 TonB-dependent receptor plug domain-containing protein [Pedobacter sp. MC2016-14]